MNNYDRIQHASVRVVVDPPFVTVQTALDEAWYGDMDENGRSDRSTGAKRGVPGRVWQGVEVTSEAQFNRLSSLIEARRVVALVDQNRREGNPYPDLEVRVTLTEDNVVERVNRRDEAVARIDAAKADGLDIDEILARTV